MVQFVVGQDCLERKVVDEEEGGNIKGGSAVRQDYIDELPSVGLVVLFYDDIVDRRRGVDFQIHSTLYF